MFDWKRENEIVLHFDTKKESQERNCSGSHLVRKEEVTRENIKISIQANNGAFWRIDTDSKKFYMVELNIEEARITFYVMKSSKKHEFFVETIRRFAENEIDVNVFFKFLMGKIPSDKMLTLLKIAIETSFKKGREKFRSEMFNLMSTEIR